MYLFQSHRSKDRNSSVPVSKQFHRQIYTQLATNCTLVDIVGWGIPPETPSANAAVFGSGLQVSLFYFDLPLRFLVWAEYFSFDCVQSAYWIS